MTTVTKPRQAKRRLPKPTRLRLLVPLVRGATVATLLLLLLLMVTMTLLPLLLQQMTLSPPRPLLLRLPN
jgi:hypothetical protein